MAISSSDILSGVQVSFDEREISPCLMQTSQLIYKTKKH